MALTREKQWLRDQVRMDYQNGMTLWAVCHKWQNQLTQIEVRQFLEGMIRPVGPTPVSEEEVVQRRLWVQSQWTPEQASKRWVGRLLARPESIHSSASRLLPD